MQKEFEANMQHQNKLKEIELSMKREDIRQALTKLRNDNNLEQEALTLKQREKQESNNNENERMKLEMEQ